MSMVSRMKRSAAAVTPKNKSKIDFAMQGDDDSVSSHEDYHSDSGSSSSEEEEEETVDAKRVRLARDYLRQMEEKENSDEESAEDDDKLSKRLEEDRLKRLGVWQEPVADRIETMLSDSGGTKSSIQYLRGPHDLTVTCVTLSSNNQYIYSGSKDHSIAMWHINNTACLHKTIQPHWRKKKPSTENENISSKNRQGGQVLCMDCQDKYLAVGQRDALLQIYNSSSGRPIDAFRGHSKAITSVSFFTSSAQPNIVMTGSEDRCIRQVSLDQMAHVETLYGHQAAVSSISSGKSKNPISVGRDRTARVWKLQEESHLIFRGGATMAPADAIATIDDTHFLTGHEDGTLAMWNTAKKRPVFTTSTTTKNYPITSLAIHTDLAITGSHDGLLRFWKLDAEAGKINPIGEIPILGYVNDIAISKNATFCALAIGQEPRLGRWNRVAKAKNRCVYIPLLTQQQQGNTQSSENEEGSSQEEKQENDTNSDSDGDSDGDSDSHDDNEISE